MDTLTRMRAFIDVVEAEGFSAAARKIGRSKALLSKYVRELEDELGALLLNRTTRQFSLTEAGHTYYKRASEIVREVDSLADAVRESSGDVRGRIKLSAPRTFADAPIGQSLIDFAKEHPDIVLEIHLDDRFVDLVEEGFDLAVRITRLESSSLIARRLAPFSLQALRLAGADRQTRQADPPAGSRPHALHRRHQWPLAVQLAVHRRQFGAGVSVSVSGPIEVNSPMAARAAAVSGLGFAILPDFIAAPAIEKGQLVPVLDRPHAQGRRHLSPSIRIAAICRPRCASSSTSWCSGSRNSRARTSRSRRRQQRCAAT